MCGATLSEFASPNKESVQFLEYVFKKNYISNRGYSRILRVARTIADLMQSKNVEKIHIAEALSYRINSI